MLGLGPKKGCGLTQPLYILSDALLDN